MSTHIVKTILSVQAYEFTGEEIGKLRDLNNNQNWFETNFLPEFCIQKEKGFAIENYYVAFVNEGEDKYIMFNADTVDEELKEQINQGGIDNILKEYDLRPIFEKLPKGNYHSYGRTIPETSGHLIIEICYSSYSTPEGTEYDVDTNLIGFLDKNLNYHNTDCPIN